MPPTVIHNDNDTPEDPTQLLPDGALTEHEQAVIDAFGARFSNAQDPNPSTDPTSAEELSESSAATAGSDDPVREGHESTEPETAPSTPTPAPAPETASD